MNILQQMWSDRQPRKHKLGNVPYYAAQAGLGSPMQRGEGHAYREGSLGLSASFSEKNMLCLTAGAILGLFAVKKGFFKKGFLGT